mmetsp:Transcript_5556/g.7411  ORF Transcript_5556/g.7411 Transcript_5556/m.7411 type:complete len:106 (+) Transcript_5556:930-1247(+)
MLIGNDQANRSPIVSSRGKGKGKGKKGARKKPKPLALQEAKLKESEKVQGLSISSPVTRMEDLQAATRSRKQSLKHSMTKDPTSDLKLVDISAEDDIAQNQRVQN